MRPQRRGSLAAERLTPETAARFGHLWSRSRSASSLPFPYHFDRMASALALPVLHGLVLDAGCGEGIDLTNQAHRSRASFIGVELSEGGCRTSFERTRRLSNASVIQGTLTRLPFADGTFDFIYSYGVLHHLPIPSDGLRELVRVVKPGGHIAIYLYEDFKERQRFWRMLLALANVWRRLTTQLPPRLLYRLCQLGSPLIYVLFTIPSRVLSQMPHCQAIAATMPFRHGTGPFSLAGDLYDRFSAPIERRYTRAEALTFMQQAGLEAITIANDRGWMVAGRKPSRTAVASAVPKRPETARVAA